MPLGSESRGSIDTVAGTIWLISVILMIGLFGSYYLPEIVSRMNGFAQTVTVAAFLYVIIGTVYYVPGFEGRITDD